MEKFYIRKILTYTKLDFKILSEDVNLFVILYFIKRFKIKLIYVSTWYGI